ncbi:MAG: hypothetical protein GXP13_02775 [Gammaproteobacteria bacterium]|nr:hypothetical protein [Gammaproteobacteria bacterium]
MSADNKQEKLDNVTEKLQAMGVMPGNDKKSGSTTVIDKPSRPYILLILVTISAFAATLFVYKSYIARSTSAATMHKDQPGSNQHASLTAKKPLAPQTPGFTNPARGTFQPLYRNNYWRNQPHLRKQQPTYSRRDSIRPPSGSQNKTIPLNNRRYAGNNRPMPYQPVPVRPYYWFNRYQNRWVLYAPRPYPYNNQQPVPYKKR